ncbi:acrylyl-CoA reductase (NADPH) [Oceanibacterium hippocampi]|uniref:Acrylyl-CoA reductase AcuI n=1 Tax=Oceanibacterium hippocampi TaxID=745714 RepID=A0A1Y5TTH2_9PROT|nr:MDR family oxidoreductase [Oceanibacterium hippocampi]SLN69848.1 Acrylyl-CoA reductase AcuI [Oceanibacterium hippocampi]
MSETFKAVIREEVDGQPVTRIRELGLADLPAHDVLVDVAYSTLNYKDGLAVSGKAPIARSLPMVCGVDLAGTIVESANSDYKPGDKVLVNGWGLSERHWGGYTQRQRVKSDWLVRVPDAFTLEQTMAIGTAGYTSMLCVLALEDHGITPDQGEILVTGAGGGVGSVAIALLSRLGYRVAASTGRAETHDYLKRLGASEIVDRATLSERGRPLDKERWAGAVDSVGSQTLATLLAQIKYGGAVAACGLAGGNDLPATVLPFILRGVSLLGVDSVMAPKAKRERAWQRLASDLDQGLLAEMTEVEPMSNIFALADKILAGQTRGRVVIDVNA